MKLNLTFLVIKLALLAGPSADAMTSEMESELVSEITIILLLVD